MATKTFSVTTKRPTWATATAIGFFLIAFGMLVSTLGLLTGGMVVYAVAGILGMLGGMFASFGGYIYFIEKRS